MTIFWLKLWHFARGQAIKRVREDHITEFQSAVKEYDDLVRGKPLGRHEWPGRPLGPDLALHDAYEHLVEDREDD